MNTHFHACTRHLNIQWNKNIQTECYVLLSKLQTKCYASSAQKKHCYHVPRARLRNALLYSEAWRAEFFFFVFALLFHFAIDKEAVIRRRTIFFLCVFVWPRRQRETKTTRFLDRALLARLRFCRMRWHETRSKNKNRFAAALFRLASSRQRNHEERRAKTKTCFSFLFEHILQKVQYDARSSKKKIW